MRFPRASGILLHPTCLPGPGPVGTLGPASYALLDDLARTGQRLWQVLPLGPTGFGDSPYQCFSAFAGNVILVSPEGLVERHLLDDATTPTGGDPRRSDFEVARAVRAEQLARAHERFRQGKGSDGMQERFADFLVAQEGWLDDYALFVALKQEHGGTAWTDWPEPLARRDDGALTEARDRLAEAMEAVRFHQFLFFDQWAGLHARATELGIEILGDLPIFVAADSADVWARPELFDLDDAGRPRVVAGVPPDYFSETGQLWGNPLYRWNAHRDGGWEWWIERMRASLSLFDRVRIDHFRGFDSYWEVGAGEDTAVNGQWLRGPGGELFEALERVLGELPIVAEDLGDLTEDVLELRDRFRFPGMRVLHFGFAPDPKWDAHSPHQFVENCVAYTGTHDNDTTIGWFVGSNGTTASAEERAAQRSRVLRYTGTDGTEVHWDLIRLLGMSIADTAIVPLQDVLGLGSEARMNVPGRPQGNWRWRLREGEWTDEQKDRLHELTVAYGR